jgi:hypothetical protein
MRIQKILAVTPAIAAGIADKVLHEIGCAALMNKPSAGSSWTLQEAGYRNRNFKLRHYPILRLEKSKTAVMSPVIPRTEDRVPSPGAWLR